MFGAEVRHIQDWLVKISGDPLGGYKTAVIPRVKKPRPSFLVVCFLLISFVYLPQPLLRRLFHQEDPQGASQASEAGKTVWERFHEQGSARGIQPVLVDGRSRLVKYWLDRRYDTQRDIFGEEISQEVPRVYTRIKYVLNSFLYRGFLDFIPLMPLNDHGELPSLIERPQGHFIVPPPAFVHRPLGGLFNDRQRFFRELTGRYPQLNVFVFHIVRREFSGVYEQMVPNSGYQRGVDRLIGRFADGLPPPVSYAAFNYSLDEFKEYFYATDHHWTIRGAWSAYAQVINMIRQKVPHIGDAVKPMEDFVIPGVRFFGSYAKTAAFTGLFDEMHDFVIPTPERKVYFNGNRELPRHDRKLVLDGQYQPENTFANYYAAYWGDDYGYIRYETGQGKRRLLLFVDSFANCMEEFFLNHYSSVHVIDLRHYQKDMGKKFVLEEFLTEHPVDDVLFLMNSQSLMFDKQHFSLMDML